MGMLLGVLMGVVAVWSMAVWPTPFLTAMLGTQGLAVDAR